MSMIRITQAHITASLHKLGSSTPRQYAMLSLDFKNPPKGWKRNLIGTLVSEEWLDTFIKAGKDKISDRDMFFCNRRYWYRTVYLRSDHWKLRSRLFRLGRAGRCERCASKLKTHVHHLSYANLWKEKDSDLELLCSSCHKKEHPNLGKKK